MFSSPVAAAGASNQPLSQALAAGLNSGLKSAPTGDAQGPEGDELGANEEIPLTITGKDLEDYKAKSMINGYATCVVKRLIEDVKPHNRYEVCVSILAALTHYIRAPLLVSPPIFYYA